LVKVLRLNELKYQMFKGEFDKIINSIDDIKNFDTSDREFVILKSKVYQRQGLLEKSFEIIEKILTNQELKHIQLFAILQSAWNLLLQNNYGELTQKFEEIETEFQAIIIELMEKYSKLNKMFDFESQIKSSEQDNENIKNKILSANLDQFAYYLAIKAVYHFTKGDMKNAVTNMQQSNKIFKLLYDHLEDSNTSNILAVILIQKGEYEMAANILKECIRILADDIKLKFLREKIKRAKLSTIYNNLGGIYQTAGNLVMAYNYYSLSLKYAEKIEENTLIARAYNNLGNVYLNRGLSYEALEYYLNSLEIKKQDGLNSGLIPTYHNLGKAYYYQRNIDMALFYYFKALVLEKSTQNKFEMANTIQEIILAYLYINDHELAREFFKKITTIRKELDNRIVDLYYKYCEALLLYHNDNLSTKLMAEQKFKLILEQEVIQSEISISVLIYLCNLLLMKLKYLNDMQHLLELKNYIIKLQKISKEYHSLPLFVESLIMEGKLLIAAQDYNSAEKIFYIADLVAQETENEETILLVHAFQSYLMEETKLFGKETINDSIYKSIENDFLRIKEMYL
jgi:tetratricopeptide (TPR) repeat protein